MMMSTVLKVAVLVMALACGGLLVSGCATNLNERHSETSTDRWERVRPWVWVKKTKLPDAESVAVMFADGRLYYATFKLCDKPNQLDTLMWLASATVGKRSDCESNESFARVPQDFEERVGVLPLEISFMLALRKLLEEERGRP